MPLSNKPSAEPDLTNDAAPPSRRRAPLTTALCTLYVLIIIGVLVVMRLMGEQWWVATLLLFSPRWLWAVPAIFLLPMALLFRRRLAFPVLLAGATVLFAVMGFRVPWRRAIPAPTSHETLRIFTCNLHGRQARPLLVDELVDDSRPDVILLQDYTASREPSVVREEHWHTDRRQQMFIASRYPLRVIENVLPRDSSTAEYSRHGWPLGNAFSYELDLPGGTIHLINLHLASPHQQLSALEAHEPGASDALNADSARRTVESLTVAAHARQIGGSFIIAGDFNTPDDSPLFRMAWHDFDDAFDTAGFGFGTTYSNHHTWLRIDHILCDPSWHCAACWVGPPIGSGHRPVMAVLER